MKTEIEKARKLGQFLTRWLKETRGSMMTMVAFGLPVILGMAGMGIDLSNWYAERRSTQNIADSASVAATHAVMAGKSDQDVIAEALAEAQRNGYGAGPGDAFNVEFLNGVTVGGTPASVKVTVTQATPAFFTSIFIDFEPKVTASAMGGIRSNGTNCIIGLHGYDPKTVNFMGNTTVIAECGVYSHSEAAESLHVGGNATLYANPAQARGDIVASGNGEIHSANGNLMSFQGILNPDPYAHYGYPTAPACSIPGLNVGSSDVVTIGPSVPGGGASGSMTICTEFTVRGDLNLYPGTYYIYDADVTINSQATVQCVSDAAGNPCTGTDGVTLVITGSSAGGFGGDIRVNGGATVDLKAPGNVTNGDAYPYPGLVVFKDQRADSTATNVNLFNGGSTMMFKGGIYIANETIDFLGGADLPGCIHLVGLHIYFSGDSYLQNDPAVCSDVAVDEASTTQQRQVVLLN